MTLGFKKKFGFKPKILDGTKKHTIRRDSKNRWKVGMTIHMAQGLHSKAYDHFNADRPDLQVVKGIQKFEINYCPDSGDVNIFIDNSFQCAIDPKFSDFIISYTNFDILQFAKNDGFDSIDDFLKYFNTDFTGKIIHWTDFKY